ncbi:MAG: hypothetical protein QG612_1098 [Pseudomonadota bacterium]|nr:hypothetical protein [Pseudomonadota bacterium]
MPSSTASPAPPSLETMTGDIPLQRRELRTRADRPDAPSRTDLFRADAPTPTRHLVVWDPQGCWPGFDLGALARGVQAGLAETLLIQEQLPDPPVARLCSAVVPAPGGGWIGVLQVEASPADSRSIGVALALLGQADHALVLAGSSRDKDMVLRIGERVRPDSWSGPPLQLLSPADKPSRADRLRRALWPRGLTIQVIEPPLSCEPDWTARLIAQVCGLSAPPVATARRPTPTTPPTPLPAEPIMPSIATAAPRPPRPAEIDEVLADRMLAVLAMAPGVVAAALVEHPSAELLSLQATTAQAPQHARSAACQGCAMWQARASVPGAAPLQELLWAEPGLHHLMLPLPRRPDLLLLACIDREFGDLAAARWQAAVARNQWR